MKLIPLLFAVSLACACATDAPMKPEDKPPIPWSEIKPVPAPVKGVVVPLPADAATPEEVAAMTLLQIPPDGFVLSETKYRSMIELRLSSEQLHADAVANTKLGEIWTSVMWKQLATADAALAEVVRRENTWWNRNKESVFFGGGFVMGAVAAILIVYGVNQAMAE